MAIDSRHVLCHIRNELSGTLAVEGCDIEVNDGPDHYIRLQLRTGQRFKIEVTKTD